MPATATSQATPETAEKPREYTLNSTHRCDRDGAQAYVKVILEGGLELLFCRHHWLEYKPIMEKQGILDSFVDESDRLNHNRLQGSEN
jgi:hypothetical protein